MLTYAGTPMQHMCIKHPKINILILLHKNDVNIITTISFLGVLFSGSFLIQLISVRGKRGKK